MDFGASAEFWEPRSPPFIEAQLEALERMKDFDAADAPSRARTAYLGGDPRLLTYCGAGCAYLVGTPEDFARLGSKTIPGAFDLITGSWDIELTRAVAAYVTAWNSEILMLDALNPPWTPVDVQLSVDQVNPERAISDARAALARGDLGLLGIYGYGASVPEFPYNADSWPYDVRFIAGTSDYWRSPQEAAFNKRAYDYAPAYNRVILASAEIARPEQFCAERTTPPVTGLDIADAVPKAREAFAAGQTTVLAVDTFHWMLPAARWDDAIVLGCRTIVGTWPEQRSTPDEPSFNRAAQAYAARWNREMLRLTARPPRN